MIKYTKTDMTDQYTHMTDWDTHMTKYTQTDMTEWDTHMTEYTQTDITHQLTHKTDQELMLVEEKTLFQNIYSTNNNPELHLIILGTKLIIRHIDWIKHN